MSATDCPVCLNPGAWAEDAWVCSKCGAEWYPPRAPELAEAIVCGNLTDAATVLTESSPLLTLDVMRELTGVHCWTYNRAWQVLHGIIDRVPT